MRVYLHWQNGCTSAREIRDQIYVEAPLTQPSVTLRRETLVRLGGYRDGDFPEDYELWLRMVRAGATIAKLEQVLLDWRQRPDSYSKTDARYTRAAFDALRADYLAQDQRLACLHEGPYGDAPRPLAIWGAGRKTRKRAQLLFDRGFTPALWIDIDRRKIGGRIAGAPVHGPEMLARLGGPAKPYVLVYVAVHGARALIAEALEGYGYLPSRDYLLVG